MQPLSVFLAAPAGMDPLLLDEAREIGLPGPKQVPGGVECQGGWEAVRRANLRSRIASRVLARIARFDARGFPALIASLRAVQWTDYIAPNTSLRLEASVSKSRASHGGAVTRHLGEAVRRAGLRLADGSYGTRLYARLDNDVCTVSLDTSGNPLHMRGAKRDVNAAPLRETLASGFLRAAGFTGQMPVFDPMCGSGTFVIEAAMIAIGQRPGFARNFAFTGLPSHDADRWTAMRADEAAGETDLRFTGRDRSGPTIGNAKWNATRAKIAPFTDFAQGELADATPPDGPQGLVITNPPYGHRLGGPKVAGLYAAFGKVMTERFKGWKIALVTSEERLAQACNLRWEAPGPYVDHGGIKIRLWQAQL